MKVKGIVVILILAFSAGTSAAARCDDLLRLCRLTEAYFRAESKVVASHDPRLVEFGDLLLEVRLLALADVRAEIAKLQRDEKRPLLVSEGGLCGFHIGTQVFSQG